MSLRAGALLFLLFLPLALHAEDWQTLMAQGDKLDARFQTQAALAAYLEADKLEPNQARLLSQIAKQYGEAMTDTTDPKEKIRLGNQAIASAKRAVAADPKLAVAQLALAVSYGRTALLLDNKTKIAYSRLVKEHVDIALRLSPENDLCWHLLGVWTEGMASLNPFLRTIAGMIYGQLPAATHEDAVKYFQKAIALNPARPGNHLELGKTYASLGQKDLARSEIEKGLALPDIQRDDPESKRNARAFLEKL